MRYLIPMVLMIALSSCSKKNLPATSKYLSGTINYKIDLDLKPEAEGMEKTFGDAAAVSFNNKWLHLQKNNNKKGKSFQITDLETGVATNYVEFEDLKFAVKLNEDHTPKIGELTYHKGESKEIGNFTCRKATAPMGDGEMIIYYTNEIAPKYCPYIDLNGFALEYTLQMPYGKVTYSATEVDLKEINQDIVQEPKGYQVVTVDEMNALIMKKMVPQPKMNYKHDFTTNDLDGNEFILSAQGKVVVLNFWFTTCPPCKLEMPLLNELQTDFEGKDVTFVGITYEGNDIVEDFLKTTAFNFTIIPDAHHLIKEYDIFAYPTTLVLNEEGEIVEMVMGGSKKIKEQLKVSINKALGI